VYKYGAFGNPNSMGIWIYGKRPDGRTVACKSKTLLDGSMRIWSDYWKGDDVFEAVTEFSALEWARICSAADDEQPALANAIMAARVAPKGLK